MTRRVVLGEQNDGSIGLRVTLPGYDAFSGDGEGGEFTFNSDWTDVFPIYALGYTGFSTTNKFYNAMGTPSFTDSGWGALFTSLGYRPFVEVRRYTTGDVVNDDYWTPAQYAGSDSFIWYDAFLCRESTSSSDKVMYIVYPLECPIPGGTW